MCRANNDIELLCFKFDCTAQRFALPACGRAWTMFGSRKSLKPACPGDRPWKNACKPCRLSQGRCTLCRAVELEDSLAKKKTPCRLTWINLITNWQNFAHNSTLGNDQKTRFIKTPNNQKPWQPKRLTNDRSFYLVSILFWLTHKRLQMAWILCTAFDKIANNYSKGENP